MELMEEVGLLDKTLRVSTGEMTRVCLSIDDLREQRHRMEGMIRIRMLYGESKHGSKDDFDKLITEETDRRLQECGVEGSSIVAAAVSTLKRNGPISTENIPVEGQIVENERREAGTSSGPSTSTDRVP